MWKLIGTCIDRVMSTLENSTFKPVIEKWNTMTVDYFLYYKSLKCSRSNERRFLLSIG